MIIFSGKLRIRKHKKINEIIKSIEREGLTGGIGKPEPLKYRKAWSRRIDEKNRLVYSIDEYDLLRQVFSII